MDLSGITLNQILEFLLPYDVYLLRQVNKYLYSHVSTKIRLGSFTIMSIIQDNVKMLQYAHLNGYVLSNYAAQSAEFYCALKCLEYLIKNKCYVRGECIVKLLIKWGDIKNLMHIYELGIKYKFAYQYAIDKSKRTNIDLSACINFLKLN